MTATNGNGSSNGFSDLESAVDEHIAGKLRKSKQRRHTFFGRHEWRRNEGSAQRYKGDSEEPIYGLRSSGVSRSQTQYALVRQRFGALADKIFEEYTPEQAQMIQGVLDKHDLSLPRMMDVGVFVADRGNNIAYFLDKGVEAVLSDNGLRPQEFFKYERFGVFEYRNSPLGGLVLVKLSQDAKPLRLAPDPSAVPGTNVRVALGDQVQRNLFYAGYKDNPLRSVSHPDHHPRD